MPARYTVRGAGTVGLLVLLAATLHAGLIGTDQERKIGRQVADELEKEHGLVKQAALVENVQAVGAKVAVPAKADRPSIDFIFKVLADDEVNAVACPGGYVYAYRGLMQKMPEEELLAAVLAHECAHVTERHGMETLERALGFSLLLAAVTGGSSDLGSVALGVLMRGYSRGQEAEADRIGHAYLFKAGYDIGAMVRMLNRLAEASSGGGDMPGFLRTHPSDENRINAAVRREGEILLELGAERPAADPPHVAIVFEPTPGEDEAQSHLGEEIARQLAATLTGSAQFVADYAGDRAAAADDRVSALGQIAAERGVDGAVGLAFTAPPLTAKGTGRKAETTIKPALSMTVVGPNAAEAELAYDYTGPETRRKGDGKKRLDEALNKAADDAARALAIVLLRPSLAAPDAGRTPTSP
jgi:Zn-dependent protease with chaperone function